MLATRWHLGKSTASYAPVCDTSQFSGAAAALITGTYWRSATRACPLDKENGGLTEAACALWVGVSLLQHPVNARLPHPEPKPRTSPRPSNGEPIRLDRRLYRCARASPSCGRSPGCRGWTPSGVRTVG